MTKKIPSQWLRRILIGVTWLVLPVFATGCATTYDAYGNPQQSVDPGVAVAGVVAAGLIGLALASDSDDYYDNRNYRNYRDYRGGSYGGYGRKHSRCRTEMRQCR